MGSVAKLCRSGDGRRVKRAGLCASCYAKAPRTLAPKGGGGELGSVRVRPELIRAMVAAAAAEKLDLAEWRRRAYVARLRIQGCVG